MSDYEKVKARLEDWTKNALDPQAPAHALLEVLDALEKYHERGWIFIGREEVYGLIMEPLGLYEDDQ